MVLFIVIISIELTGIITTIYKIAMFIVRSRTMVKGIVRPFELGVEAGLILSVTVNCMEVRQDSI
jgi:hypothetical protein